MQLLSHGDDLDWFKMTGAFHPVTGALRWVRESLFESAVSVAAQPEAMPAMQGEVRNLARSKGDSWLMLAAVAGSGCHVLIPLITQ